MRDFVCGGDRSIIRFVCFHAATFVCSLWQHAVMLVMAALFILRLLCYPQRRHPDGHLHNVKTTMHTFCSKHVLTDMKIRNAYNLKAAVVLKNLSVAALNARPVAMTLYFLTWKPILLTLYVVPIVVFCREFPQVNNTAILAGVAVGWVVVLVAMAYVHDWVCHVALVPLFHHVETDANAHANHDVLLYPGPTANPSTSYTRLASATDGIDHNLYCIPVPPPPFVASCNDLSHLQSIQASLTYVSRESSNDSVTKKPPRHSATHPRDSSDILPTRLMPAPLTTPTDVDAQNTSARSTSRCSFDTPSSSYALLPRDRPQNSTTPETKVSGEVGSRVPATASADDDRDLDSIAPHEMRRKMKVPTNVMLEYDSFDFDQDGRKQTPPAAASVYRSAPDTTLSASLWTSPTNYASVASDVVTPTYGHLSPTSTAPLHPTPWPFDPLTQVFRTVADPSAPSKQDSVHLLAYAPPSVSVNSTFPFAIWAFLVHQRQDMHERATSEDVGSRQLSREVLMSLRRGAIAHVHLEVPAEFIVEDGPIKAFTWTGDVTSVKYNVRCIEHRHAQVLFKATVVVGANVMVLRSYVFVTAAHVDVASNAMMEELTCELELLPKTFEEIPYDLLDFKELIGEGHFGDAYRAEYNGKNVVVKTLKAQDHLGGSTDQVIQEFRHEAAVLNMFGHHPNIVPFVGASTDPSRPLTLVTAFLPQGSLERHLSTTPLSVHQKEILLGDASAGVLNIHEGGFVHRDIAARNCLVDDAFRIKICDFGLCRRVNAVVGGSFVASGVGPLKYMAPESLVPPHTFSYGSDVFSFGVLMWETFAETGPFADLSGAAAAAYVLEGGRLDIHLPSSHGGRSVIPDKYHALMASCFAEDPSKRPTMSEVHRFLR
ncbi:hypothetical protein DYB32_007807 [Aphanomyces invadans]|uniref:Protein kinase domain-containing protein n=1 Tax=Aphanomyces invadans TaxID=157072 RepID=A0A3R6Y464_9STRA|nr:hypothetical protein DYB32_007807 [Aphanomyces invadans]